MNPSAAAIEVSPTVAPVLGTGPGATVGISAGAPDEKPLHRGRPDSQYHVVLLTLSAAVLLPAFLLSVRGGTRVVLPVLGLPLPELCMMRRLTGLDCPG